jgi:hypothetical protein
MAVALQARPPKPPVRHSSDDVGWRRGIREELRDRGVKGGWRLGLSLVVALARAFFDHLNDPL